MCGTVSSCASIRFNHDSVFLSLLDKAIMKTNEGLKIKSKPQATMIQPKWVKCETCGSIKVSADGSDEYVCTNQKCSTLEFEETPFKGGIQDGY